MDRPAQVVKINPNGRKKTKLLKSVLGEGRFVMIRKKENRVYINHKIYKFRVLALVPKHSPASFRQPKIKVPI